MMTLVRGGMSQEKLTTPYLTAWFEDGILCCRYADDVHVTVEVAKACVEDRIQFCRGRSYPVLIDMKGMASATEEAREYLATIGVTSVRAGALITGSAMNRTIGNLFLAIDKPLVPTRLFTDEAKARHWLQQFK